MITTMKVLLGAAFALSPIAASLAQQNVQTTENENVERIQVTGSNIRGVNLEGTQPLQVITSEDIKNSGATSIFELLKDLNQTRGGQGTFSTTESGGTSTSSPAGQAAASLRGMGPSSTLTLVNGRRIAPSSFAAGTENFVDINSIPLAAIERIEVLATGASAIYGADAVAGVINYILKKDYQGAEVNLSYSDSTENTDESKKNINLVWGANVLGGNLTLFADLYDKNAFAANNREATATPLLVNSYSYLPKLPYPNIYYFSSRDGNELANPNCPFATTTTEFGEEICAYYGNDDVLLDSELESYSTGAIYTKNLGGIEWNTDVFFSNTKSVALSRPAPINDEFDGEGPFVPYSALDIYSEQQLLNWQGVSSPFDIIWDDPFSTQAGQRLIGFRYDARFSDPRTVENETQSFRVASSLQGEINDWLWEVGTTYSRSESDQVAIAGIYNRYQYTAAVHGELCSDGSIANYDQDADSLSCASGSLLNAFNPFVIGDAENDSVLAATQAMPTRNGQSSVWSVDAKINGELMEFGDDYIRAAFGVEFRKEDLRDIPSLDSRADFNNGYLVDVFGFGSSLARADRSQFGAFSELHVPLHDTVELQIAARYDDYDDFGSTVNPKFGIAFRPNDEVVLRGSWATSFRAPSLTQAGVELRTTQSTFDCASNADVANLYCEGEGRERSTNTLELGNPNLKAEESESLSFGMAWSPTKDTTITVDYWAFDHEKIVDTNMTGILARAITDDSLRHCGLVPNGEIGISYDTAICRDEYVLVADIDGERVPVDPQGNVIVDDNGDLLPEYDDFFYSQVTDNSGNLIHESGADLDQILERFILLADPRNQELDLFRDHVIPLENTGTQKLSGIDIDIAQDFDMWGGTLSIDADWTHYLSFERNKPGSDEIEELIGTYRYPENIANLRIGWGNRDYFGSFTVRYTDSYQDDISGLRGREIDEIESLGALNANGERDVDSWTIVDANFGMDFQNAQLSVNIDNLFDEAPPVVYGASRGIDTINHNANGRVISVRYSHFFK